MHVNGCLAAHPEIKKAELVEGVVVEGVVYVGSPVRATVHGRPHAEIVGWLAAYASQHPDLQPLDNATVMLDADNEVQPEACLWRAEPSGPRLAAEGDLEGAPQLVVEVAASSASYDLHDKLRAYRRNGVREYVVWRVMDGALDWFRWHEGEYVRVEPNPQGIIESTVFPGLRLHVPKLLAHDLAGVLAEVAGTRMG